MSSHRPPLEKTIVAKVLAMARALGWWAVKMHGNQYMVAGLPDVLVIRHGRVAWMEVKRPGEEPTRVQEHRMRELARAGCPVTVVRSAADARHFLESLS
jgi:Holliday junction resolvase